MVYVVYQNMNKTLKLEKNLQKTLKHNKGKINGWYLTEPFYDMSSYFTPIDKKKLLQKYFKYDTKQTTLLPSSFPLDQSISY